MSTTYAFISRHVPTTEQAELAAEKGIELVVVGDMDAFSVTPSDVASKGEFAGVVVVHPAAALRLNGAYSVGVFENGQRSQEGGKPTFFAKALHIFHRQ
jgi:hypothetical protein